MKYKIGDYLVNKKDICKVKDIKTYNNVEYYMLAPLNDESLSVALPTTNTDGIRDIMTKKEALSLIDKIKDIKPIDIDNRMIANTYRTLLNSGNHEDLIKIIKTTYLRNQKRVDDKKKLSEIDTTFFEMAENSLYTEVGLALKMTPEETKKFIHDKLKENEH